MTSWAARFSTVAGNSSVGCTVVSSGTSGCTSAGAQKTIGSLLVGGLSAGTWTGASTYLVQISNYSDTVSVQRGVSAPAAAPAFSRSGTVSYFNGTGYSSFSLGTGASTQKIIGPATWTTGSAIITATGTIDVTGTYSKVLSTSGCKGGDGCSVSAGNGWVQVVVSYEIQPTAASFTPWTLTVITNINGAQAASLFKENPNA